MRSNSSTRSSVGGEGERFAVQGCRDTGVINTDNQLDGGDRASNHQLHDSIRGISRYGERLFEAIDESRLATLCSYEGGRPSRARMRTVEVHDFLPDPRGGSGPPTKSGTDAADSAARLRSTSIR